MMLADIVPTAAQWSIATGAVLILVALWMIRRTKPSWGRFSAPTTGASLLSSKDMVIDRNGVTSSVDKYEDLFEGARTGQISNEDSIDARKAEYDTMVQAFYNLVTDFYEWGWGQSFHFAPRFATETFEESIRRSEHYIAYRLGLTPTSKAVDVGCGIGGPMRHMHEFCGADITGVTISQYQVNIGNKYNKALGLADKCRLVQGDFQKLAEQFPANTFDAAFAIESTVHSPDRRVAFKNVNAILKPGGLFALYEWVILDRFDKADANQVRIKEGIEAGNGIPTLTDIKHVFDCLDEAGFDVVESFDANSKLFDSNQIPWFDGLNGKMTLKGFRMTRVGRWCTKVFVTALESLGIAPSGSSRVAAFLNSSADDLIDGGNMQIFTPNYFILARKR
ncbi:unnamed protein product (mitochondrion) [Plasmodiophora brassicae]|uniref:Methyltransferase n=1 Tax=Plasmodiophora brassicae TaxID=37360 RepID=A0A3P3YPA5_PLABS|nr:unnamed protein product [Plasmodiophora brassicae]